MSAQRERDWISRLNALKGKLIFHSRLMFIATPLDLWLTDMRLPSYSTEFNWARNTNKWTGFMPWMTEARSVLSRSGSIFKFQENEKNYDSINRKKSSRNERRANCLTFLSPQTCADMQWENTQPDQDSVHNEEVGLSYSLSVAVSQCSCVKQASESITDSSRLSCQLPKPHFPPHQQRHP